MVAVGVPHHITRRGNNRQDVFLLTEDRRFYIETLRAKCRDHGVVLSGYCLMTNHAHLIATPARADSLALAFGQTHGRYARWFNKRYRRSGHLWQNRFYSSALGGSHLAAALAYVDLNPVRAGLVRRAEDYEWSSARAHAYAQAVDPLIDRKAWRECGLGPAWAAFLATRKDPEESARLRDATYSGRPFGDEAFVDAMERLAERTLRRRRPGPRPRRASQASAA